MELFQPTEPPPQQSLLLPLQIFAPHPIRTTRFIHNHFIWAKCLVGATNLIDSIRTCYPLSFVCPSCGAHLATRLIHKHMQDHTFGIKYGPVPQQWVKENSLFVCISCCKLVSLYHAIPMPRSVLLSKSILSNLLPPLLPSVVASTPPLH